MIQLILICALILLLCVGSSKLLYRFGVPTLLIFLVLGMLFGSDGIAGIQFDDYELTQKICSVGLIFIMFFGGYGTNWKAAKPVIAPSIVMSSLGVVLTAGITGFFCYFLLGRNLLQGLLIGAVISSTDAASVFAILRSRNLNMKNGLASLLEVESGSNDPFSWMLTVIMCTIITGNNAGSIGIMLFSQIGFGLLFGILIAGGAVFVLKHIELEIDGLYPIFLTAMVLLGYGLCEVFGGNGYLCVYMVGIIVGNSKITHKRMMFHFFDGLTWIMQIMLFFTLGLLAFPSRLPQVLVPGILLSLFLIFVARPAATFLLLSFFKFPFKEKLLVSWVGLRGAASIVFAIYAVTVGAAQGNDIFHLVFFVALFSVMTQGTLIPPIARKLKLVEPNISIFKTFTDYEEESPKLKEIRIDASSQWADKTLTEAGLPRGVRVIMIKRKNKIIVPDGTTQIQSGDVLILSGDDFDALPV